MRKKRRALVLVDESARHPFRRSLPPHVCKGHKPRRSLGLRAIGAEDWRGFLAAYCTAFLAVTVFIA